MIPDIIEIYPNGIMRIILLDPILYEVLNSMFSLRKAGLSLVFIFKDEHGCNKTSLTKMFDKAHLTASKSKFLGRIF